MKYLQKQQLSLSKNAFTGKDFGKNEIHWWEKYWSKCHKIPHKLEENKSVCFTHTLKNKCWIYLTKLLQLFLLNQVKWIYSTYFSGVSWRKFIK